MADIPEMISYASMIARVNHMERKTIRIPRDLMEMAELGIVCPEYKEIINQIQSGVYIETLPSDHILKQFVRKKKGTGEMKSAYK